MPLPYAQTNAMYVWMYGTDNVYGGDDVYGRDRVRGRDRGTNENCMAENVTQTRTTQRCTHIHEPLQCIYGCMAQTMCNWQR